jgi:hypothetical protein
MKISNKSLQATVWSKWGNSPTSPQKQSLKKASRRLIWEIPSEEMESCFYREI